LALCLVPEFDRRDQPELTYNTVEKTMSPISRKQALNEAFKRFQRLPELRTTENNTCSGRKLPESMNLSKLHTIGSRAEQNVNFTKVLAG